jgi:ribokinase
MDIVGLGLATLDVLMRLKDMPTWERPGRLGAFRLEGGGPVGTACVAAARLGARVGYVGTAGNDECAELKLGSLREGGVDLSRLVAHDEPEKQLILVYVHQETGERVFSGVEGLAAQALSVADLDRDYLTSAEYLHLDGFHMDAALKAAQWMHAAGKAVMLDAGATRGPVSDRMRTLVGETDVLLCGSGFAPALTGCADLWEAGEAASQRGPRIVVQTEGKDGSYTVTPNERFHTPAFDVEVVDTTGAGDVFHGAYLVGLLRGWDLRTIATFSSAVSALNCTKLGGRSGIPTFGEVRAFLEARGVALPR